MFKIFLSHSSKDKGYVEIVAKKLQKYNLVYDSWTFDAGEKTIDEIYRSIEETGLFVLFISESSLQSAWVQREIFKAKSYIENGKITHSIDLAMMASDCKEIAKNISKLTN